MKSSLEYLLFASVARLLQLLPLRIVRGTARLAAHAVYYLLPVRKKLTVLQLRKAFPETSERKIRHIALGSYVNLLTTIFEMMWTPRLNAENLSRVLRIHDLDVVERARRRGSGLIIMSGHFGNWEWLSTGASQLMGFNVTVVVHPIHNPAVDALVEGWRQSMGNRIVDMGLSIREIIRALRNREVVAMLADQSGPSGSLYVRFFGHFAATYEGPATFALRTGAPVIMSFAVRANDGNYDVLQEEIPTADLRGLSEENLHELTRRHVRALERMIRRHPEQWLWQHRRWKHAPHEGSILIEDPDGE
ncbi:MAG: lysophospholipid acyltransferase family protein [Bacteroidota bacterium]|nr:lysophospholipid acyltransferase family protein [Bacteroidota bacterium]